jgi:glycosyltransferase involved in cell wall biosynthesis
LIPNGVDKNLFYPRKKDLDYLIYCSAPNRGLKRLPLIFDAIRNRSTRVVYMKAFSNMKDLHPNECYNNIDEHVISYKECDESGIEMLNPVPQHILAEELGAAGLMILPTDYPEICSNVILQSLASGTPIITTGQLGSSCEWLQHSKNGMVTKYKPYDYMVYTLEMVRNALYVLDNERLHKKMIDRAFNTKINTWEEIGAKWDKMLRRIL